MERSILIFSISTLYQSIRVELLNVKMLDHYNILLTNMVIH